MGELHVSGFDGHYLLVGSIDQDTGTPYWSIEHPAGCPTVVRAVTPEGEEITDPACVVGSHISNAGIDSFGVELSDWPSALPTTPGRYRIESWSDRFPSGPWGGEEWSAGLALIRGDDDTPISDLPDGGLPALLEDVDG